MSVSICETCRHRRDCNGAIVGNQDTVCTGCSRYRKALPVTNADRIRSMTDEELAKHLNYWDNSPLHASEERWLDWLKREVEND